jgi:ribokinase
VCLDVSVRWSGKIATLTGHLGKVDVPDMEVLLGGCAANVARALRKLGCRVDVAAPLHPAARCLLLSALPDAGLCWATAADECAVSVSLHHADGDALLVHRPRQCLSPPWAMLAAETDALLLGPHPECCNAPLLDGLRSGPGMRVYFMPGNAQLPLLRDFLATGVVAWIQMNEREASAAAGITSCGATKAAATIASWLPPGCTLIVTSAAESCAVNSTGRLVRVRAPATNVVDSTGAGDAFAGACLASLGHGAPLEDAMRNGHANAASTVRVIGAGEGHLDWPELFWRPR